MSSRECPFGCGWTTDDLMSDPELAAVEGGQDRLALHLRVEHGTHPEREAEAWEDGGWAVILFGFDPDDPGRRATPPLSLSEDDDEG